MTFTFLASLDLGAKALMAALTGVNYSQEDPREQTPGNPVSTHLVGAAMSSFRETTLKEGHRWCGRDADLDVLAQPCFVCHGMQCKIA